MVLDCVMVTQWEGKIMRILTVLLAALGGTMFTMNADGSGLSDAWDRVGRVLNVYGYNDAECDEAGGVLVGMLCVDVDY